MPESADLGGGWMVRGSCAQDPDPETWFANDFASETRARTTCMDVCPVRRECLFYVMNSSWAGTGGQPEGIWAGLGRAQRIRLARRWNGRGASRAA